MHRSKHVSNPRANKNERRIPKGDKGKRANKYTCTRAVTLARVSGKQMIAQEKAQLLTYVSRSGEHDALEG